MASATNVYCDESGHLERDRLLTMVLGAVWCPAEKAREVSVRLREIKAQHGMSPAAEAKWNKVSPGGTTLYLALLDYFFDDDDLHFRALVVPDKHKLNHMRFHQTHDDWFFKMYFQLLSFILEPRTECFVYLDAKDTRSSARIRKLHEVLAHSILDFDRGILKRVQAIRSHESELLQLADLLIGAVSYANRGHVGNAGKQALVERMRARSGYSLTKTTLLRESKVNVFVWNAGSGE